MIVLDTNVISEPLKRQPDQKVLDWLDRQEPASLCLSAMSLAEVWAGIESAPAGKYRQGLHDGMTALIKRLFEDRQLPFDEPAAYVYASIQAQARKQGRHIGVADGIIAATALARGFIVASRDIAPYQIAGLEVINPWMDHPNS